MNVINNDEESINYNMGKNNLINKRINNNKNNEEDLKDDNIMKFNK